GAALGLPGEGVRELAGLVDASMVAAGLEGSPRYTMLEPVRMFAHGLLEAAGELQAARTVLAGWAREQAATIERLSRSRDEAAADELLRRELRNLRAAHLMARDAGDLDTAIDISAGLRLPSTVRDL